MKTSHLTLVLCSSVALVTGCLKNGASDNKVDSGVTPDTGIQPGACTSSIQTLRDQHASELASWSVADPAEMVRAGGSQALEADYAGKYRDDLVTHPGCTPRASYTGNSEPFVSDNEATVPAGVPATIPGFPCAAKEYTQPNEDLTKPIVILVHGNSSGTPSFEEYFNASKAGTMLTNLQMFQFTADATVRPQLATKLLAAGYRVISFDGEVEKVGTLTDYDSASSTGNPFKNIDHGWAVPMAQSLIKSVMIENPGRKVSLVGHSLGVTVIRDALRRLYLEHKAGKAGSVNPYAQVADVVLLSGANHGVRGGQTLCDTFSHMRGKVGCEMGDRGSFQATYFSKVLNGPSDVFSAPCADGDFAYGDTAACGSNTVQYTTITMKDLPAGALQDEFVSETSARLELPACVDNQLIGLDAYDSSGYFFTGAHGFLANHFGSARSDAGITLILQKLAD